MTGQLPGTPPQRLTDRRRPRARAIRALHDISLTAARVIDSGVIAETTTQHLLELFQADTAVVWLWDEANADLYRLATSHTKRLGPVRERLGAGEGFSGAAFTLGELLAEEDYAASPYCLHEALQLGVKSCLAVPLVVDGRPIGVLCLSWLHRQALGEEERDLAAFLAERLAPVAEAMHLRVQLRRRRAEAEALADLARQGVRERDMGKVLTVLARHAATLLNADYAIVAVLDGRNRIALQGRFGMRGQGWRRRSTPRPGGVTDAVLAAGKTLVFEDPERFAGSDTGGHAVEGGRSVLATPLPCREGMSGVLHVGWRTAVHPGAEDSRILETLAAFAANIIDNAQSHLQAEQFAGLLEAIVDQMPSGVAVVDAKARLVLINRTAVEIMGANLYPWLQPGLSLDGARIQRALKQAGISLEDTALARALSGERIRNAEYPVKDAHGRQLWLQASATALHDASGELSGAVSVFSDVTEAKLAQRRRELDTSRQLAVAAISQALSGATRDVKAMLDITSREVARALRASCAIELREGDHLRLVSWARWTGAAPEHTSRTMLKSPLIELETSPHKPVIEHHRPARWFDPEGRRLRKLGPPNLTRTLLRRAPLYARLAAPLHLGGQVLGVISLYRHAPEAFCEDDEAFVCDVGERAGIVLENARLFEQLTSSRARLEELSQRLVQLQEHERRAIALELHDEVGQVLTATRLLLEAAKRQSPPERDKRLSEACEALDEAVAQVRGLSLDLRPPMLGRFGLASALDAYFERFTARTGIQIHFEPGGLKRRPSAAVEMAAYRIVQEGLTNVARHASTRKAEVELWSDEKHLWARVSDEGAGFDVAFLEREQSTGLTGMQERAELLGGAVIIDSSPGRGTTLLARLPLQLARRANSGRRRTSGERTGSSRPAPAPPGPPL